MIFLDAYALVAFFLGEAARVEVRRILREERPAISTVNLAEVVDVLSRLHGQAEQQIREIIEPLVQGTSLGVIAATEATAWRAGALRAAHYDRGQRSLSLADCFLLASAGPADAVATADPPVAEVARAEGIGLVALPDSRGRLP